MDLFTKKNIIIITIILLIICYFMNMRDLFSNLNDNKTLLINEVTKSNSNEIAKDISQNMHGSTMHHHFHILYDIRTLLGPGKKIYTEIGSFNGGSFSLMLSHNYETELNSIDPFDMPSSHISIIQKNVEKYNKNNHKVNIMQNFSTDETLLKKLEESNFRTDILFIDGDHSYEGVKKDYNNYAKFVNKGGWIVFDDYEDSVYSPEVKVAVDEIISNINKDEYEVIGNIDNIKNAYDEFNKKKSNEYIIIKK